MIGFDFLRQVSAILSKSLTSADASAYSAIFDILDEVIHYESATLFVANPDSEVLEVAQSRGPVVVDLIAQVGFEHGHGLSGWTGARREPLVLPSLGGENVERGFASMVSMPLWIDERLIGVLNLGHSKPDFFNVDNSEDYAEIGIQLTIVVEQLRLRSQLRDKNLQLEKLLIELKEAQDNLVEKERLAAIGELVVKVNHEINNPLAAIISLTDLLLMSDAEIDGQARKNLQNIRKAAYRIHDVTEALKKIETSGTDDYIEGVKMLKLE